MNFYEDKLLPHIINCACSTPAVMTMRKKLVPQASGVVLEVGMGSGINLEFYDPQKVSKVWGLEPAIGMRDKARGKLASFPLAFEWLDLPGEQVPLPDNSVDTVLLTFTLCSIPDWQAALKQMHRVLKPSGRLLFCEHGLAPDDAVRKWQERINPLWQKLMGGCQVNRPMIEYIQAGGFTLQHWDSHYLHRAPKFAGYVCYGEAVK